MKRLAYTFREAGEALGVSPDLIAKMRDRGELRAVRLGSKWVVPAIELDRLLGLDSADEDRRADIQTLAAEFARLAGLEVTERQVAS